MNTNFAIKGIPAGLRFYQAYDSNLMLFGWVSMGIKRDALRLSYMADLSAVVAEAANGRAAEPRFFHTVAEAAQYMAGLIAAEVAPPTLNKIRRDYAFQPENFAPYTFGALPDCIACERAFALAFEYATGGRVLELGACPADDEFASAMWEAFAADFLTIESVAA